ncbi:hypothetical protein HY478_03965 [Candidatus Uhrbacteria bacterium]|nr:hypothetical protein [Candidatus Uhrbacteria bacterium]
MVRARKELPPSRGEVPEGDLEEIAPIDEIERRQKEEFDAAIDARVNEAQEAERRRGGGDSERQIEARRREIAARARLITEGLSSLKDMPPEIAEVARKEVTHQVDGLVSQVLANVVAVDKTGALRDAMARAEEILGKERHELSPTEQLRATLMTRLEWLAGRGELQDQKQMDNFVQGMEKAGKGAVERLAALRKQKRPPSSSAGGRGASPEARA